MKTTSHGSVIRIDCGYQGICWRNVVVWLGMLSGVALFWWASITAIVALMRRVVQ